MFFADPHSPWQRPTNENTDGLLRQYFPKGTDMSRWSAEDLEAVALAVNNRPRKVLPGRLRPRSSRSSYCPLNNPVLQRLVEPAVYTFWIFGHRLREAGLLGSMGRVASSVDNTR